MVLAETGEADIAMCEACGYAANMEKAAGVPKPSAVSQATSEAYASVETPGKHTVEHVSELLKLAPQQFIKTLIFIADGKPVAVMVQGDREVNEIKVQNAWGPTELVLAPAEKGMEGTGVPVG